MFYYLLEAVIFGVWYYWVCMEKDIHKMNTKEVFHPVNVLAVIMIATGMCFFVNFQMPMLNMVLPEGQVQEYNNMLEAAGYGTRLIPTIICLALAPLAEEFLFRGVLFYYLLKILGRKQRNRKTFWIGNLIQALLFGAFHMNLIQSGYAFVIGMVLGYLAYQFESVIPAIMSHMIINFLSAFIWEPVVSCLPTGYSAYAIGAGLSWCVIVLGMTLCVINSDKIGNE